MEICKIKNYYYYTFIKHVAQLVEVIYSQPCMKCSISCSYTKFAPNNFANDCTYYIKVADIMYRGVVLGILQMLTFFRIRRIFDNEPGIYKSTILNVLKINSSRIVQVFVDARSVKNFASSIIITLDDVGSRFLSNSVYFYSYTGRHIGHVKSFIVVVTVATKSFLTMVILII
jgi:hypothetical protein